MKFSFLRERCGGEKSPGNRIPALTLLTSWLGPQRDWWAFRVPGGGRQVVATPYFKFEPWTSVW